MQVTILLLYQHMYLARNETSKTDSEQYIAEIIISDTYDMKIYAKNIS